MHKQIILLNGPSSSGKSTLARFLRSYLFDCRQEKYEIVSIDDFLPMTTDTPIYEDDVFEISLVLCRRVREILETVPGVIIDHVITSPRIYNQLTELLSAYSLHSVRVTCPVEILLQRELARHNRCIGSAVASLEYLYPQDGYELTVDTHHMTADECAAKISQLLIN